VRQRVGDKVFHTLCRTLSGDTGTGTGTGTANRSWNRQLPGGEGQTTLEEVQVAADQSVQIPMHITHSPQQHLSTLTHYPRLLQPKSCTHKALISIQQHTWTQNSTQQHTIPTYRHHKNAVEISETREATLPLPSSSAQRGQIVKVSYNTLSCATFSTVAVAVAVAGTGTVLVSCKTDWHFLHTRTWQSEVERGEQKVKEIEFLWVCASGCAKERESEGVEKKTHIRCFTGNFMHHPAATAAAITTE